MNMDRDFEIFFICFLAGCPVVTSAALTDTTTTVQDTCNLKGQPYCLHGASCTNTVNGALCHCTPEYSGEQCDTLKLTTTQATTTIKDSCNLHGQPYCLHGANCTNTVNGALCHCTSEYMGEQCEAPTPAPTQVTTTTIQDSCNLQGQPYCLHGANCTNTITSAKCHCTPEYMGDQCETLKPTTTQETLAMTTETDWCAAKGQGYCQNGGSCINATNGVRCICLPQYTGVQCSVRVASLTYGDGPNPSPLSGNVSFKPQLPGSEDHGDLTLLSQIHNGSTSSKDNTKEVKGDAGCSVLICHVIIPTVSVLAITSIGMIVAIYCKAKKMRQDKGKITPRTKVAFV